MNEVAVAAQQVTLTEMRWEPLFSPWGLGLFSLILLVFLAFSLAATTGQALRIRVFSLLLRTGAAAGLFLVASGPVEIITTGKALRDPLILLIDRSLSMSVKEGGLSRADAVAAFWTRNESALASLRQRYDLQIWGFDSALHGPVETPQEAGGSDGADTDLLFALEAVRPSPGEPRPAAVLLVSDGADRASLGKAFGSEGKEGVADLLSELPFPVHTLAASSGGGIVDLRVEVAHLAPFAFVRRPVEIAVRVKDRDTRSREVPVSLLREGKRVATETARIDPQRGEGSVTFSYTPDRVGWETLSLRVPVPSGDQIPANNGAEVTLKVIRDRTRILQVTSHPSWDVKFLRSLLKSDPNVDLVSFFIMRTQGLGGAYAGEELSLIEFPHEELFGPDLPGFDLVILQNFAFERFLGATTDYYGNLASYVEKGGALLMVGGDRAFTSGGYAGTPLERVLPVSLPSRDPLAASTFRAVLTPEGERHPVTRLGMQGGREGVWEKLPPLKGWNDLGTLAQGGVALARVDSREGPLLMAARSAGKGRTLAVGTDSSWRWAMSKEAPSSRAWSRFWQDSIRWLVRDVEQKQVEVLPEPENQFLGEKVRVEVRVRSASYAPLPEAGLEGVIGALDGSSPEAFSGKTDASGTFILETTAKEVGTRRITVKVPSLPGEAGVSEARFSVTEKAAELLHPEARPDLLKAIADATSGTASDLSVSLADIPLPGPRNLTSTERSTRPLWNRGGLLLLLAVCLSADWVVRRRRGLL